MFSKVVSTLLEILSTMLGALLGAFIRFNPS